MKVLIETTLDGNRDVNRGELWRTLANVGERRRTKRVDVKYSADVGERPRTIVNSQGAVLKTARVQALVGSNPTPSANFEYDPYLFAIRYLSWRL